MAIDIKAILGDTKSTVMTPAEIANLGLRRKAVKIQQENLEFNRQDSLLSSLEKFATNADTASEFNQLNSELNTISGQIDDPILKAKFGLISSYTNEEHNKYKDFQTSVAEFNARNEFERDQLVGVDSTDYGLGQVNDKWWNETAQKDYGKDVKDLSSTENIELMAKIAGGYQNNRGWNAWTTFREGTPGSADYKKDSNYENALKDIRSMGFDEYAKTTNLNAEEVAKIKSSFKKKDWNTALAVIMAESNAEHSAVNENESKALTTEDLWEGVNGFKQIANKVASEDYAKFMTPELQAQFQAKSEHFASVGEALVTGDIITAEEWNVIENGGYDVFIATQKMKKEELSGHYDTTEKEIKKLRDLQLAYTKENIEFTRENEADLVGMLGGTEAVAAAEYNYTKLIADRMTELIASQNKINEQYKVWTGTSKIVPGMELKYTDKEDTEEEPFEETLDPKTGKPIDYEGESIHDIKEEAKTITYGGLKDKSDASLREIAKYERKRKRYGGTPNEIESKIAILESDLAREHVFHDAKKGKERAIHASNIADLNKKIRQSKKNLKKSNKNEEEIKEQEKILVELLTKQRKAEQAE